MSKAYKGTTWRYWFKGYLNGKRPYTDGEVVITYNRSEFQWEVWSSKNWDLGTIASGEIWKEAVENYLALKKKP